MIANFARGGMGIWWWGAIATALSALLVWRYRGHLIRRHNKCRSSCRRRRTASAEASDTAPRRRRTRSKPDWVRREIIRLKAHLPEHGCRKVSDAFNREHVSRGMSVCKTTVANVIRAHHYEIAQLRRTWKTRIPAALPINNTWGIDATGKTDESGKLHSILGIVDHGPRRAIALLPMRTLTAIAILRVLLDTIERFGIPKIVRSDNAAQFRSVLFRFAMAYLGIGLRFNKPGKPWMNGRVERFFGTLKERLNHLIVADFNGLHDALGEFKAWYNHARPHQHLQGRTPFEVWNGIDPYRRLPKDIRYVVGWDGLLTGFYSRY